MSWNLVVTASAEKQLKRFPEDIKLQIRDALIEIAQNPFSGDEQKLQGLESTWRRRCGAYRIVYEVEISIRQIFVYRIVRRSSNSY